MADPTAIYGMDRGDGSSSANAPDTGNPIQRGMTTMAGSTSRRSDGGASSSSSLRSSGKTLSFFKSVMGHRSNDYHTDAPTPASAGAAAGGTQEISDTEGGGSSGMNMPSLRGLGSRGFSNRSAGGGDGVAGASGGGSGSRRCCGCFHFNCSCCRNMSCCTTPPLVFSSAPARQQFAVSCISSRLWRWLLIFFTFMLLFGAQIRELFFPKQADLAFDIIFMVAFVVFCFDILMRVYVEPNYFTCTLFSYCRKSKRRDIDGGGGVEGGVNGNGGNGGAGGASAWPTCGNLQCGSFIFWCELVSTCAMLFEISFINKRHFQKEEINIGLDDFGIPQSGMDEVNESSPVELQEVDLLITIAKTLRVARFIRSSTAVKISSKVNWFWFFNAVNPVWWWNSCRSRMTAQRTARQQERLNELASDNMGAGGGATGRAAGGLGASARQGSNSSLPERKLMRRKSWGGIGLGALSAAKAAREAQEAEKKNDAFFKKIGKKVLRTFRLIPPEKEQWTRHLAATKIQRAWRRVVNQRHLDDSGDDVRSDHDFAWKSNRDHGRLGAAEDQEKASLMRSMKGQKALRKIRIRPDVTTATGSSHHPARSVVGGSTHVKRRSESQVGSAMRELTGQRVAIGIILALVFTVLFTYTEDDATRPATMIVLHNQTANEAFANKSLEAARHSSIPDLYEYQFSDNSVAYFTPLTGESVDNLREKEILRIQIDGSDGATTVGLFANRAEIKEQALISLLSTIFIILVWFFGVTAFAGPVMILVVIPIERMVRLLGMLMLDPLGYQSTSRYKKFVAEEDEFTKNTRWTKDVLKGMETSFLMLTISRIGSLMKVGFGSAGVEIIRNNLEKGHSKNMLILTEKGSNVSCIFLFCDIRQFTDATECLQEEVFVFTNRVAAVVHSICHSYGGSANKNIGDAFLVSWQLEEDDEMGFHSTGFRSSAKEGENFVAKHNQADKALLSVVKICMALHYNDYYLEKLSETARKALLTKLAGRSGPVVQLGFGLHAGSAVQGAIGSQRKIDATYVSESVERAEDLEGWTKTYGVKMLMSDSFCRLLHPSNRRRCRKIDQLAIRNEDDDEEPEDDPPLLELWTFDMDIDALWRNKPGSGKGKSDAGHESDSESTEKGSRREVMRMPSAARQLSGGGILKGSARRRSMRAANSGKDMLGDEQSDAGMMPLGSNQTTSQADLLGESDNGGVPELTLPTGPALYNANVWVSEEMRRIRELYSDGIFFQKFNSGFQSYYARDWEHAKQCFVTILERFEDGPSRYFLTQIEKNNGKPPRDFRGYGIA